MNFLRKFIGNPPTEEEVAVLPSGKFFLTRSPSSPKGAFECLYADAYAVIKATSTPFLYQLCVTKGTTADEGAGLMVDEDSDDESDRESAVASLSDAPNSNTADEWSFVISDELEFSVYDNDAGAQVVAWRDVNGDVGDRFEFVVAAEASSDSFVLALFKCVYEAAYEKPSGDIESVDDARLKEFMQGTRPYGGQYKDADYNPEGTGRSSNPGYNPSKHDPGYNPTQGKHSDPGYNPIQGPGKRDPGYNPIQGPPADESDDEFAEALAEFAEPHGDTVFETASPSLYYYDARGQKFVRKSAQARVRLIRLQQFEYTLYITSAEASLNLPVSSQLSPTFNYDKLSFVFVQYVFTETAAGAFSWLLRFGDRDQLTALQSVFTMALWETINRKKYGADVEEQSEEAYLAKAMSKMDLEKEKKKKNKSKTDLKKSKMDLKTSKVDLKPAGTTGSRTTGSRTTAALDSDSDRSEDSDASDDPYDSDSDDEYVPESRVAAGDFHRLAGKNTALTIGGASDRAFVTRGNNVGVFSTGGDGVDYVATLKNVADKKGAKIDPQKSVLHQRDQYLVMKGAKDDVLYQMDVNRGTVVDEWQVGTPAIADFGPNAKYAQLTSEPTMTGIHANGIFRIDPRLPGDKLVADSSYKNYKTKNNRLSVLTTTEQGYTAVGSDNGDIRLFDQLGKNAKSRLPSLGEPYTGLDVSADGRWLLATCRSFLLLMDLKIGGGQKNEGSLGFTKYFDADKKPVPWRLQLRSADAVAIARRTRKPVEFTRAQFNAGSGAKESRIVTSAGPFVVSWALKDVLRGRDDIYTIHESGGPVVADSFRFGSNKEVIYTLANEVGSARRGRAWHDTSMSAV
ncbi:vacuolar import and degradation protein 27 [Diutina catenulata]